MRQEKWDEFHKKFDEALDSEFGKSKVALREYLLENKEQVTSDLEEMREKSNNTKETLEEAAEEWAFETNGHKWSNNDGTAGDNYGSFIAGAKWQEERMYNEEDMKKAFKVGFSNGFASDILSTEKLQKEKERLFCDWFEQFKKK